MRISILGVCILICASCISELEFELPEQRGEYGVNCILVHNEAPKLVVYRTVMMTDTTNLSPVFDAQPVITRDDGVIYSFGLADDSTCYYSKRIVEAGHTYLLEVSIGQESYSSKTTVPQDVNYVLATHNWGKYFDEYGDELTSMRIEFEGNTDQMNYYQLFILDGNVNAKNEPYNFYSFYNLSDPVLLRESLIEYEPTSFVFSDHQKQDKHFTIELLHKRGHFNYDPLPADLVLRSISEEYIMYLKSWFIHYYNQNNQQHVNVIDDLDPYRIYFQEQPTALYSNISGGVGIFAGYAEKRKSFVISDE